MSLHKTRKLTYDWEPQFSYDKNDEEVVSFYSVDKPESATNDIGSIFYKKTLWDIFVCAMAIGKHKEARKPLVKPSKSIPVDFIKENHIVSMLGVAFSDDSIGLEILQNPKELRVICEEYANAGFQEVYHIIRTNDIDKTRPEDLLLNLIKNIVVEQE